jgi:predicted AAA+ superfamily ATPase
MFQRFIAPQLIDALSDTPVVVLQGARQTGKSTLAQRIASEDRPADYLSMDHLPTLSAAQNDPAGFLAGLRGRNVVLDEIQRAPDLYLPIKAEVDRQRSPGRFLLTGSANVLLVPKLAESLVGRMELVTLWPLAQCEMAGAGSDFIENAFSGSFPIRAWPCDRGEIIRKALAGGYPEAVSRDQPERRASWFEAYVTTLLQRDVRDLANIQGMREMPLLLALIASRATAALNVSDLSRSARIPVATLNRYLTLLQATFLLQLIPPWSSNLSSRLVKAPKLLLSDTGVLAYLNGYSEQQLLASPSHAGALIENFCGMEIMKLASWSALQPRLFYFRTHDRREVDFVLQTRAGKLAGVEVKASASVGASDFSGLRSLADLAGDQFASGIVLYTGEQVVPFGERLFAVPMSALWQV